MRYFYSVLFYLALPFLLLRLLWRSRKQPGYRQRISERLGYCPYRVENSIWVHAVSVGETIAAVPLIKALQLRYPNIPIVVTTMSVTGSARVKALLGTSVFHSYVPYDTPDAVARFLQRIKPRLLIVMETELWPNLFAACQQRHIPIIVTNARLSAKSAAGYQRIPSITQPILQAISKLAAQGKADGERFIELGMKPDHVCITGSLKFDLEMPSDLIPQSQNLRQQLGVNRLIWIAASTHQGEEEIILTAHKKIREQCENALLILVPRHPERFNSIANLIEQQHFSLQRRSQPQDFSSATAVYLADSMGELLLMYAVADVAFVGGSLVQIGGHNMLEPAALSKPILVGPHLFNFAEISEMLLTANAMRKITRADELANEVLHLFEDAQYRKTCGENALRVVENNRGGLHKQTELIATYVNVV